MGIRSRDVSKKLTENVCWDGTAWVHSVVSVDLSQTTPNIGMKLLIERFNLLVKT